MLPLPRSSLHAHLSLLASVTADAVRRGGRRRRRGGCKQRFGRRHLGCRRQLCELILFLCLLRLLKVLRDKLRWLWLWWWLWLWLRLLFLRGLMVLVLVLVLMLMMLMLMLMLILMWRRFRRRRDSSEANHRLRTLTAHPASEVEGERAKLFALVCLLEVVPAVVVVMLVVRVHHHSSSSVEVASPSIKIDLVHEIAVAAPAAPIPTGEFGRGRGSGRHRAPRALSSSALVAAAMMPPPLLLPLRWSGLASEGIAPSPRIALRRRRCGKVEHSKVCPRRRRRRRVA